MFNDVTRKSKPLSVSVEQQNNDMVNASSFFVLIMKNLLFSKNLSSKHIVIHLKYLLCLFSMLYVNFSEIIQFFLSTNSMKFSTFTFWIIFQPPNFIIWTSDRFWRMKNNFLVKQLKATMNFIELKKPPAPQVFEKTFKS